MMTLDTHFKSVILFKIKQVEFFVLHVMVKRNAETKNFDKNQHQLIIPESLSISNTCPYVL